MTLASSLVTQSSQATKTVAAKHEEPWKVLDRLLPFLNSSCRLWWDEMAPVIGRSMLRTGYSIESQYKYLLLVQSTLIPFLGPFPNQGRSNITWPSCIAGDKGPLDISVNYQGNSKPTFRITIEPIGPYAGTDTDLMNEIAPRQLLHQLSHIQPGVDLTWYDQLEKVITIRNHEARQKQDALAHYSTKTQTLIGLDFHEGSFTVKAYFFPHLRASVTGEDWARILFDGIRTVCNTDAFNRELTKIEQYIGSIRHKVLAEKPNVAFDCKDPAKSRIKVYAAVDMSSLDDVYDFWTIGGHLHGPHIENGFEIVRKMWNMIYTKSLPNGKPRESMTVHCNWELSISDPTPAPKAYFLVADDTDQHVSSAITNLFRDLGWDEHAKTHNMLEKEAYPAFDMKTSTDVYTWLSFAHSKKTGPYITVYTKPLGGTDEL
ncbi:aromatic prenyltransferase [Aspergillus heteromorphus CBS 117.55]|uniref:Aromatic prenyltransferase n=1 Tax=Aspergillus heteromorphus CBS 117.55 TaxID=1448321 RepID=A0A317WNW0_9EURO|nr:aromatic prenyltransferase [Aspergillus heteromorphus CBS 117.55]PWY85940.1 aromatic prenyltransferase [Aspergillus heteromorphus CBS 117.55]